MWRDFGGDEKMRHTLCLRSINALLQKSLIMRAVLRKTLLLLTLLLVLVGCGGGSSNPVVRGRSLLVDWPERSRDIGHAPSSALSVKITVVGGNRNGTDLTITEDRENRVDAYTATYAMPDFRKSASAMIFQFYSLAGGTGDVVGIASAQFSSKDPSLSLDHIVVDGKIVTVEATGATVMFGNTAQLLFTAKDRSGNVVAVSPGSATWELSGASSNISISSDGVVRALAVGTGLVTATVDGSTSAEASVKVIGNVSHVFHFANPTDTIQFKGGTLDGAVSLGNAFTVEAYVRPTNDGFIWQQWRDSDMNETFVVSGGRLDVTATGSGQPESHFLSDALDLNEWNHVAWVYDGTNVRLYENGVLIQTVAKNSSFAPVVVAQAAALGKNGGVPFNSSDASFTGDLAWFKVSNTVRYTGSTYVQPGTAGTADGSTLLLIDASSFSSAPTTFSAPGAQGITANVGVGNGSSTSPTWIAP